MSLFAKAAELEQQNQPFALATITETKGSAPRHNGQMIVEQNGAIHGTVGGGMIERHIIEQALEAIQAGEARQISGRMARSGPDAMDMDCGGAMSVHIAVHGIYPRLFLIGAGHVNRAIAHNAARLGFEVIVADAYAESLAEHHFPAGTKRVLGDTMLDAINKLDIDAHSYVIIATNHQDGQAMDVVAQMTTRYTGLLGSKRKVQTLFNGLRKQGVSEEQLNFIHSPVGFKIGAETPEEIAISVMAEVLLVRNCGEGAVASQMKDDPRLKRNKLVYVRGAGDMATGVALRLHNSGYQVVMSDIEKPTAIRRSVAFAQAIFDGQTVVEGVTAQLAKSCSDVFNVLEQNRIAVVVDPETKLLSRLRPQYVVDAILAKRNLGTTKTMAPVTIGLGPGFTAGEDVHAVIETNRGHHLGRILYQGKTAANTGIPGNISGYTHERVLRAPAAGTMINKVKLGDIVAEGDLIAQVGDHKVVAPLSGMVRGLLTDGLEVTEGFKIGDIDPRGEDADFTTVSDKARAISGSVLEAMMALSK
ncbi:selenium-dependent molybdenum cofactor biosynthesis protein YqeB [Ferrimonas aestuarii]|uniref:EF2563 family selenium-dependent molybdenum hydroxylase system protein n=1 Tax=Ferrimonas aestuarii TaxID=2569539 RepID=A0A4U1BLY2_9GAMM|nr:selenium-dependent molybdenum cofactor biosynthesis protein YqeB [Ferrimonas aestuarii]TKB51852.1 EF2563 family selenium-dependent molybdenum hydroxylase system protein [Ferrimonas aestuarii]